MTREEAIEILKAHHMWTGELQKIIDVRKENKALEMAIQALSQEQKSGKWIEMDGYDGDVYYDCSECGESWTTIEGTPWDNGMKFCPNCGSAMKGE